jgi:hypothetical protein
MEQKFGTKIKNAVETRNPITAEIEETGSYMDLSFRRAPKKNHDNSSSNKIKLSSKTNQRREDSQA